MRVNMGAKEKIDVVLSAKKKHLPNRQMLLNYCQQHGIIQARGDQ